MNAILKNFIAGEWIDGTGVTRNINPSNTNDVVGEICQGRPRADREGGRRRQGRLPGLERAATPQERYDDR